MSMKFKEGDNLLSKWALGENEGVLFCDEVQNNLMILHCIVQLYKWLQCVLVTFCYAKKFNSYGTPFCIFEGCNENL